jgi:transcriptional regulator with XRE-family HTH domain
MESSSVEVTLANRLRMERETRNWTLADLATRSGVSRAMLSKIERCEASPTAALLGRLSGAFGLTLSQLFARVQNPSQLARSAEQPVWRDPESGFLRRSLSPPNGGPTAAPLELVWGELPPGATIDYPAASYTFIADQQLVVIDGALTIRQADTTYQLLPGDCLRFGHPREVTFQNPGPSPCRYVLAVLRATGTTSLDSTRI